MNTKKSEIAKLGRFLVLIGLMLGGTMLSMAMDGSKSVVGTIEKVDAEAKVIYVKTKDGTVKAYKWVKSTTTHGIKSAEIWSKNAVHKGANVAVRAIEVAGEDTIKGIHWFGQGAVKVSDATISYVEKNGKKVALTVSGDAKKVYSVSEHAVVDTGTEVVHGFKAIGRKIKTEAKGVVHIIEKDGKSLVHHIEHRKE